MSLKKYLSTFIKLVVLVTFFGIVTNGKSQDSNYYLSAFGLSGENLKQELNKLISNHVEFPYTSTSTDVWDILKQTDKDINDSNKVILLYSGRSINAAQEYNSGSGWSREHVWAKSRGDFGTSEGPGTDVHHLRPADVSVNSTRNNRNFDNCSNCSDVIDNGVNTGSKTDIDQWIFEPRDEVKGDVARMIFYMSIRYEGNGSEPDLELTTALLSKSDKRPLHSVTSTLLKWHLEDPVNDFERNRNTIIYNDFQKNRNPFIDYPELAEYIWGKDVGSIWRPSLNFVEVNLEANDITVYPNPTNGIINISGKYSVIKVYTQSGKELNSYKNGIVDLSEYKKGVYLIRVISDSDKMQSFEVLKL